MLSIVDLLKKEIFQSGVVVQTSKLFASFSSDEERVHFILETCAKYKITPSEFVEEKNIEEARKWRDKGNKIFVHNKGAEHLVEACELYTKSIAFAPIDSNELALAFANRSAVLFRLGKYEQCVEDIERCLRLNYPDNLRLKILLRKTECLSILKHEKAQKAYEETLDWIEKKLSNTEIESNEMKKKLDHCYNKKVKIQYNDTHNLNIIFKDFEYEKENPEVPSSSDFLTIEYNETFGRHIVAAKDIRPGQIIAREKPYCMIVSLNNKYTHCWGCLEYIWNGIPCDHCVYAMYCSETCKNESWKKYHDIECSVLKYLLELKDMTNMEITIISFKVAILAVRELGSISNLMDEVEEIKKCTDARTRGFSSDGKFHSDRYRSVYSLVTNVEKRFVVDLFDRATFAVTWVYFLATKTEFFGQKLSKDWDTLSKNKNVVFIASLLMRHLQIAPSNFHSIAEERDLEVYERGSAVMPFFSLANHSCDANASRCCHKGYQIMFALYPIKKGEQVFDNYGNHYAVMSKNERQEILSQQYFFNCNCMVCKENWPLYKNIKSYNVSINCNKIKSKLEDALSDYKLFVDSAMTGNIRDKPYILKDVSKMIEVLMQYVKLPCKEVNDTVEMLKRIFDLNSDRFVLPKLIE